MGDADGVLVATASGVAVVAAAVVGVSGAVVEAAVGCVVASSLAASVVAASVFSVGVTELTGCDSVLSGPSSSRGPSAVVGFSVDDSSVLAVTDSVVASDLAVILGVVSSVTDGLVVVSVGVLGPPVDVSNTAGSVVSFAATVGAVALASSGAPSAVVPVGTPVEVAEDAGGVTVVVPAGVGVASVTPFFPSTVSDVDGVVSAGLVAPVPGVVVMSDGHSYRMGQQCPGSVGMATHPSDGALHSFTAHTTS